MNNITDMDTSEKQFNDTYIKEEIGENSVGEENTINQNESSEDSASSPTTGDNTVNPWISVKCVFCHQILNSGDHPKLMECLHTSCASCITAKLSEQNQSDQEVIENNAVKCPACGVHCQSGNVIDNQFLLEAASGTIELNSSEVVKNELKCMSCQDNATASSWCVECSEYICDGCVQAHQRLKITKEHTIKSKDEADQENQTTATTTTVKNLHCSVHRQETLTLFCETCDRLTCRDCQLSDHRDHKYKFIHEIAEETKGSIKGLLSEVSYKRVLLTSAMKVIDDRQALIMDKKKNLVKDITHMVVKLTSAINHRGKQLVMQLNEVCDAKHKTLKEKKVALEQLSNLTDHCIEFVNGALNRGSDMALLYTKRTVTHHLQRIKSRRADIPNPEIPVRIGLVMDKVPDLIKVISGIGGIVVDGRPYCTPQVAAAAAAGSASSTPPGQPGLPPPPPYSIRPPTPAAPPLVPVQQVGQPVQQRVSPHMQPNRLSPHQNMPLGVMPPQAPRNVTVLRHPNQQVTSSTHPQSLGLDSSGSLRGLLTPQVTSTYSPMIRIGVSNGGPQQVMNAGSYRLANGQPYTSPPLLPRYSNQQQMYQLQVQQQQQQQQHIQIQQQLQQPHIQPQHQQPRISSHGMIYNMARPVLQARGPSPQTSAQQSLHQWHIPQHGSASTPQQPIRPPPPAIPMDDSYKIMLKTQVPAAQPKVLLPAVGNVTSSVPKTPSPGQARSEDAERSLDKFCQESVNDLMATIAKLDRNGIEVVPEGQKSMNSVDMPLVDSSTGLDDSATPSTSSHQSHSSGSHKGSGDSDQTKDDPNEDWCAVCMDGGEVVVCCDKCPKVFHTFCHIPKLDNIPDENETWQCLLCTNMRDVLEAPPTSPADRRSRSLSSKDQKVAERILLELYCQYEPSLHFREVVSPEVKEYHAIIKKPMSLDIVRNRLNKSHVEYYSNIQEFVQDIRLIFKNAYSFNHKDSQVYQDAKTLEEFFDSLLEKWLPAYAYDVGEGSDDDGDRPPQRKYRRILSD